ncbi:MAG: 30S ribosomal protein S7 [Spirochaetia bacterium]|jgi:small subunit ribosomal protein S7|nr:30S ribosomal protein S7 [Spirochaetia bacterium]
MSRKGVKVRTTIVPDPRYGSTAIAKFITRMMLDGKKSTSTRIMYDALAMLSSKTQKDAVEAFTEAMEKIKPLVEVKSRRVGGSTYQVPVEIRDSRRDALATRWLITAARSRSGRTMGEKLGAEFFDAFNSTGTAFKKKEDTHRMAEANKAFSHYRW